MGHGSHGLSTLRARRTKSGRLERPKADLVTIKKELMENFADKMMASGYNV